MVEHLGIRIETIDSRIMRMRIRQLFSLAAQLSCKAILQKAASNWCEITQELDALRFWGLRVSLNTETVCLQKCLHGWSEDELQSLHYIFAKEEEKMIHQTLKLLISRCVYLRMRATNLYPLILSLLQSKKIFSLKWVVFRIATSSFCAINAMQLK